MKEHDDSSASRNSLNHRENTSPESERMNLKNLESEMRVLMYLDEKNEAEDEAAVPEVDPNPDQAKERANQVEKKLDFLFSQEAPADEIGEERSNPSSSSLPQPSPVGNPPPGMVSSSEPNGQMSNFFSNETGSLC